MAALVPKELSHYLSKTTEITEINYPVLEFPDKVKSMKLEKEKRIEGKLMGIKGQYLILDSGVTNIRSQTGARVTITY